MFCYPHVAAAPPRRKRVYANRGGVYVPIGRFGAEAIMALPKSKGRKVRLLSPAALATPYALRRMGCLAVDT